jgi:sulfoxide reductase heme-binding subunit YedZ
MSAHPTARAPGAIRESAPARGRSAAVRLLREHWLWLVANIGAAIPFLYLTWAFATDNLSVNPIDDFTEQTGQAAIALLGLSLAVTPINIITGWRQVVKVRKSLGLWAFFYVVLHMLVFVGLDYGFSLEFILKDGLPQKPYIVLGLSALIILIPLALTSTKGWQKQLGKNWKRLHNWVYGAGILAALHYIWLAKLPYGKPTIYAIILALLLIVRIAPVRKAIVQARQRWTSHSKPAPRERPTTASRPAAVRAERTRNIDASREQLPARQGEQPDSTDLIRAGHER